MWRPPVHLIVTPEPRAWQSRPWFVALGSRAGLVRSARNSRTVEFGPSWNWNLGMSNRASGAG
ncbi:hypothetical protein BV133_2390 [Blastochloris viridis]|uniref:Uncharacterized protein n=1 Tax=Blastochloris viridis TaxID=1079 RepID=A0A182D489_BLAVI|nr:hypothetical protein BV133_2390 [Blastochloris viridis]